MAVGECSPPDHGPEMEALVDAAFAQMRSGRFAESRETIERIEAADADNSSGAHARIHLHIDEGTFEEGVDRGLAFLATHDPFAGVNVHNAMHLASLLLDLARAEASVAWQARVVVPVAEKMAMQYPSAAHLLWQSELRGYGRDAGRTLPWEILVRPGATAIDSRDGRPTPADAIAMGLAWVANGDRGQCDPLIAALHESHEPEGRAGQVAAAIAGFERWWAGDYGAATAVLATAIDGLAATASYPGEFQVIEDTLIDAEWRAGAPGRAEAILRQRLSDAPRPHPRDQAWLARVLAADGRHDEARTLAAAAAARWSVGDADSAERAAVEAIAREA